MITKVTCSAVFRLETEASDVLRKVGRKEKWWRNGHLPAIELSGQVFRCQPSCFLLEGGGRLNLHLFLMAVVVVIAVLGELQRYTAIECLNCLKVKNVTGYSCNSRNLIAAV